MSIHRTPRASSRAGAFVLLLLLGSPLAGALAGVRVPAATSAAAAAPGRPATHPAAAAAPESLPPESEPAPLLIPGRESPGDTAARSRVARAHAQYDLGRALEKENQPAAAIAAYRNAIRFDPGIRDAHYRSGMLFVTVSQVGEAVKEFAAELEHHPDHDEAAREFGLGLARTGEADRGVAQLELLCRRRPSDGEAWRALGFACAAAHRPKQSEEALRHAVLLMPKSALARRDLAVVLAADGREAEAREQYRRAIALEPKDATLWLNLGNLERKAGRLARAAGHYREAERRDTTLSLAYQGEAWTLRELKRDEEAGQVYRRWLHARPDDQPARMEAVRFFDASGRKDIALEIARDGVRRDKTSAEAHLLLGLALQSSGEPRLALAELRKAEALFKATPDQERARRVIATMRAAAPDSLRAMFAADSVAHAPPPPDPPPPPR